MKNKFIATIAAVVAIVFIICTCAACAPEEESVVDTTEAVVDDAVFKIPTVSNTGGYEIKTDAIYCKVVVDGVYKYSCFESYDGNRKVEFYAGPTEMILVDMSNGQAKYYIETYEDVGQTYTNPLERVYGELEGMVFHCIGDDNNGENNCYVFESIQTSTHVESENIRYNVYSIEMDWNDGERYTYKYYDYADGSTLISAEAPDEINPRLVADTKWIVDLDNLNVRNTETDESVPIRIVDIAAGEGLSPDGGDSTIVEKQYYIYAYVNKQTGAIEKLKYSRDESGTDVMVLNSFNVVKPEITNDMTQMDTETLQLSMMLIYMLESLI